MTVFPHANCIFRRSSDPWKTKIQQRAWCADSGLENLVTTTELHTGHSQRMISGYPQTCTSHWAFSPHWLSKNLLLGSSLLLGFVSIREICISSFFFPSIRYKIKFQTWTMKSPFSAFVYGKAAEFQGRCRADAQVPIPTPHSPVSCVTLGRLQNTGVLWSFLFHKQR